MARKIEEVYVSDEGRDKGKCFVITEMPASRAEKWAARAMLALAKSGVDLPQHSGGMAGLAYVGMQALSTIDWHDAEPLLDEMWECVKSKPDPRNNPNFVRSLVEEDIEEVATRIMLRMKIFNLHTSFFSTAEASPSVSSAAAAAPIPNPTSTSRRPLVQ